MAGWAKENLPGGSLKYQFVYIYIYIYYSMYIYNSVYLNVVSVGGLTTKNDDLWDFKGMSYGI